MSFTDQKPFIVSEKDLKTRWGGGKPGEYFRCGLCGYRFCLGDTARWQYTNDTPEAWGNPMICEKCDGPREEIITKWKRMHEEAKSRMWWFCKSREG